MSQIQAFDYSLNLMRALLWQYNKAERLEALIQQKQDWYSLEHSGFWTNWTRDVFDLRTANDFGLAVWSIILNLPLAIAAEPDDPGKPIWGFDQYFENFENGNFASVSGTALTTEQKRLVLRLRYFQLVTRATVPEINAFFSYLFAGYGPVYVNDGDMVALYVFEFALPESLLLVLTEYDLLPRPAGVKVDSVFTLSIGEWGFGRHYQNFNNGNFYHA